MRSLCQGGRVRVTYQGRLQVESTGFEQGPGESWDVLASVALACHVQVLVLKLRECFHDVGHHGDEFASCLVHSREKRLAVGEASSDRLINIDHSGLINPGLCSSVHVVFTVSIFNSERTAEQEVGEGGARTGPTVEPDSNRCIGIFSRVHPVEKLVRAVSVACNCTCI